LHRSVAGVGRLLRPTALGQSPSDDLPPTILLVEDEVFVREVAGEVLASAGYRVLKAVNASEALRIFRAHAGVVDLLVADVVLPDRNGCDLAAELLSLDGGLRAVLVSGYPENSITREGLKHPGWFYLAKPFSVAKLLEAIQRALPRAAPGR
jgi:two-component system, cell cycle sensor histidine kinase and response regulator CckA